MWTAKIVEKTYQAGMLKLTVAFNDGVNEFTEVMNFAGGSDLNISQNIQNKIDTLNNSAVLSGKVSVGPFVPLSNPPSTALDIFLEKYTFLKSILRGVEMGLIDKASKAYIDAFTDVVNTFDQSFTKYL